MASINSAQHTQHMEGAEHRRKSERKQTTSSAGSAALSPLAGGSGRGIAAGRVAFRTSAGRVTEALAMLSDERTAQNKKRRYMTSRGMKLKTAIWLWQRIKILYSIPSNARVQGKKRANLWGLHAHFGANMLTEFQCLKNSTRIQIVRRIR